MIDRALSTLVEIPHGSGGHIAVELEWNGAHTVNASLFHASEPIAVMDWSRQKPRIEEGDTLGCCSIGDYAEDAATLEQFLECVREFEADPFNHPLWTG